MIRKNSEGAVKEATAKAAKTLSAVKEAKSPAKCLEATLLAMGQASELKGVGPATAALIASLYDPDNVPFFQDELFAWCVPERANDKLKYDRKEYSELFKRACGVRERLGHETGMVELEKASFVLEHVDLLDSSERKALEPSGSETEADKAPKSDGHSDDQDPQTQTGSQEIDESDEISSQVKETASKARQKRVTPTSATDAQPKPKRRKK